jgi:hypothetical protein
MKTLVDDFSVLAVEKTLLQPLTDLLKPETIVLLDDNEVEEIAAGTDYSRTERIRVTQKLRDPENAHVVLRSLNHFRARGESSKMLFLNGGLQLMSEAPQDDETPVEDESSNSSHERSSHESVEVKDDVVEAPKPGSDFISVNGSPYDADHLVSEADQWPPSTKNNKKKKGLQ